MRASCSYNSNTRINKFLSSFENQPPHACVSILLVPIQKDTSETLAPAKQKQIFPRSEPQPTRPEPIPPRSEEVSIRSIKVPIRCTTYPDKFIRSLTRLSTPPMGFSIHPDTLHNLSRQVKDRPV